MALTPSQRRILEGLYENLQLNPDSLSAHRWKKQIERLEALDPDPLGLNSRLHLLEVQNPMHFLPAWSSAAFLKWIRQPENQKRLRDQILVQKAILGAKS
jgi:hypothetical protein